ncbi:epididymis-specific alpha-mannosidase-like isoform X2 [Anneissia japonica]|uniref:epididymis-specific alpha-mannosidase-like isoform X2 n=1 Tax=Anneissia japonica TaxID=1529436 RepID=UPI001425699C|nr:epididymis-specific alpha-mannosidase-like isoform X2 [Anneissia japonica]
MLLRSDKINLSLFLLICVFFRTDCTVSNATKEADKIQAFVIPHSHMDVGWVYTVEASMRAYAANVYTTVVENLVSHPEKRFIAVEQEFFRLWWNNVANNTQKDNVHDLIEKGQMEFIIGGQVMNDEAVTEYSANIQQLTEGHAFIYETFGVRPQFSWHVDPFGATASMATLFSLAGFNAHLTSRIDYDKKEAMMKNKGLQFVWQSTKSFGASREIFTHVMDSYSYCVPSDLPFSNRSGFYWNGIAVFPDPPSDGIYPNMSLPVTEDNLKQYADVMVGNIKQRAAWFKTNNVLWPWGCDKQFFNATIQFKNMDKLLAYIQEASTDYGVSVKYATLGEYFEALHATNVSWDVKSDGDFVPYSSGPHEAWTGFYTSRNFLKGLARHSQSLLHAGECLFSMYTHLPNVTTTINETVALKKLKALRWASAEVQHHDGVTGTESPVVRDMYVSHLSSSADGVRDAVEEMIEGLISRNAKQEVKFKVHVLGNKNSGALQVLKDSTKPVPIIVYNPLGWSMNRTIRLNVTGKNISVKDADGKRVPAQIVPPFNKDDHYQLFFFADVPAMGYTTYFIGNGYHSNHHTHQSHVTSSIAYRKLKPTKKSKGRSNHAGKTFVAISNQCYKITVDKSTNLLESITLKESGKQMKFQNIFMEYDSHTDVANGQVSNNYIFRPKGNAQVVGQKVVLDILNGALVHEIRQSFYNLSEDKPRYMVTLRLYTIPDHYDNLICNRLEMDLKVGPLLMNKELVTRFTTSVHNGRTLYTDENAYQMMKRPPRYNVSEPIAQNYYPMVSTAFIEDVKSDIRFTALSERTHGVSSLGDGEIEIMLHRRLMNNEFEDHNFNLTLNDSSVVQPRLWLLLGNKTHLSLLQHQSRLQLENPPLVMSVDYSQEDLAARFFHSRKDLPANVHLLTLKTPGWNYDSNHLKQIEKVKETIIRKDGIQKWKLTVNTKRLMVRFHHLYAKGEHPSMSKAVAIDAQKLLATFGKISVIDERSLTGLWSKKDLNRWKWNTNDECGSTNTPYQVEGALTGTTFTIVPQDIRTFFVEF